MSTFEELKQNPKIQLKESSRYPGLFVAKYKRSVFYNGDWDRDTVEARGHVFTTDGKEVIKPFTKIFNRFENNTDISRDELCVVVHKVNGFMAAATWVAEVGEVVVSTTGSLDSDYVTLAEKYINEDVKNYIKSMMYIDRGTYLFEICDPSDPHIIPEKAGAYLIGFRHVDTVSPYFSSPEKESDLDVMAKGMGVFRPEWTVLRFSDIVEASKNLKYEGFVVYGQESKTALKIKTQYYLTLKAAARRKDIMSLDKTKVDEEFYPLIDHLTKMGDRFIMMDEQQRLDYMRNYLERYNG
jgi:hypothetical protein